MRYSEALMKLLTMSEASTMKACFPTLCSYKKRRRRKRLTSVSTAIDLKARNTKLTTLIPSERPTMNLWLLE